MKHVFTSLALLTVLASPSFAGDDEMLQPEPCGVFCKVWRNLSGRSNMRLPASSTVLVSTPAEFRPLTPAEEGRRPNARTLVAVHGEVVLKTAAERAREKRMLAEEDRIDALRPADQDKIAEPSKSAPRHQDVSAVERH